MTGIPLDKHSSAIEVCLAIIKSALEQILYEYLGMNLSYAPRVWHAKNAKIGLVLLPIPELGFYPLEYYLYEFKDVGENLSYNKKYWDQYSSKINEYLQNITYPNIRKIETDKIFCNSLV